MECPYLVECKKWRREPFCESCPYQKNNFKPVSINQWVDSELVRRELGIGNRANVRLLSISKSIFGTYMARLDSEGFFSPALMPVPEYVEVIEID